ncbi:hypothetical protein L6164_006911 [Bauhinia variegata]|uniref:Uncharacterized protein n=1 Tax=Bauhinia variegata TaxID=167791 RepID=A0ACB9PVW9_BAUVA|nr:hypothetical protein L6164_006911 [Bauhinia variegata]
MSQSKLFSSGLELANLVASPGLLRRSWKSISDLYDSNQQLTLEGRVYKEPDSDLTIIAFVTTPVCTENHLQPHFVSSEALRENNVPHFEFLCSKNCPSFSVNKTAVDLFCSHHEQLCSLKYQIDHSKPLIVTGHALGGSIAALFTLWLLGNPAPVSTRRRNETVSVQPQKRQRRDSRVTEQKRPLCITFGSPLIGDENLQKTISESSIWNSCFLNVASHLDPIPRLFVSSHSSSVSNQLNTQTIYKPFGTFLLSSNKGSACFEDPESIVELLVAMGSLNNPNQGTQNWDYGIIVKNLSRKVIYKDSIPPVENISGSLPLRATITLQLRALGIPHSQQLMEKLEVQESKLQNKKTFDASKKLLEGKKYMIMMEWYKKKSKLLGVGYYDNFRKEVYTFDQDALMFKKKLRLCWEDMVAEAEKKPHREGAALRKRWLTAGTNFRRMVEPLDIAEYYKSGRKDYVNQGRSTLYIKLEEWLKEDETDSNDLNSSKKENVESILTLDSSFWARVEEALLLTQQLASEESSIPEKDLARSKLIEFEEYVFGLLKNYAVSSEIFLKSSCMKWWSDYKKIAGDSYDSPLANFMNNPGNHKQYAKGEFDFP